MKKRLLSTLLALCMMLVLLPGTAFAEQGGLIKGTELEWTLDNGTLSITGNGYIPFLGYYGKNAPWYANRDKITTISIGSGITLIGEDVFYYCNNVRTLKYEGTVDQWNTIPVYSGNAPLFSSQCRYEYAGSPKTDIIQSGRVHKDNDHLTWTLDRGGLLTISGTGVIPFLGYYGKNAPWYASHSKITGIVIGNGITAIGEDVFYYCENVTHVSFPGSLTKIYPSAFRSQKIRVIHFTGTKELWYKIDIDNSNNASLFAPSVDYTYNAGPVKRYSVTYDPNGGTCDALPQLLIPGDNYITPTPAPTRYGYIFSGWYTAKTGGTAITNTEVFNRTSNQTLYAQWIPDPSVIKMYTIKLDANGGKVSPASVEVASGETYLSSLPKPTRSGYKFDGWYTAKSGGTQITSTTKATKNQTIYAHWTSTATSSTYTITLNANGGKVSPASLKVASGKTYYSSLPTPTRTGYKFAGWYTAKSGGSKITSSAKATKNQTIYAHWSRRAYTVSFDANGGSVYQDTRTVYNGISYRELPTPTRPGYHFKGWYTKKSGGTKVAETTRVNLTADQTLYAQWVTSATVKGTPQKGTWRVIVPAYYDLALYTTNVTPKVAATKEMTSYQTITCTQKVTLSNGTVRYYGKVNNRDYWFTYSCEMDV